MKKNNIFLTLLAIFLLIGCSTYDPKYREGEPTENFEYPTDKKIEKSFYLLGDGGYSPPGGSSEGLIALKNYMDSVKVSDNYTILLGDNIYPVGMPPKDSPEREAAEYRLDAQLDAFEKYEGKVVVVPGNHDWYNEGINGLERQKKIFTV
ncbi:metallophosphoesterase [Gillisia marina]|uniref:metallophosphoesterase n=1 Tax=Gillisia marina TaxID=1167637 RepID=UPI0002E42392|nr:metallophosphoesterase [Gillisia marina]